MDVIYASLRFLHPHDIAWLVRILYDAMKDGDTKTTARIGSLLSLVSSLSRIPSGSPSNRLLAQETLPEMTGHKDVFLVHDTLLDIPVLLLSSITISVPHMGKIYIKSATVHTKRWLVRPP